MADDDDSPKSDPPAGAPMWIVTFSDMMSLLLCFFVLLLSFSTISKPKFIQATGSIQEAFGIQKPIIDKYMPMGTSMMMQHFSPGKPTPLSVPINSPMAALMRRSDEEAQKEEKEKEEYLELSEDLLYSMFKEEIEKGNIEIEKNEKSISIRVPEKASFDSGSATFKTDFARSLGKLVVAVTRIRGTVRIAGHTDDEPISTERYRSNWELSSSRAVTVAHAMMKIGKLDPKRFIVSGHADTVPLVPNDSPAHRAKNRRVEVVIEP